MILQNEPEGNGQVRSIEKKGNGRIERGKMDVLRGGNGQVKSIEKSASQGNGCKNPYFRYKLYISYYFGTLLWFFRVYNSKKWLKMSKKFT